MIPYCPTCGIHERDHGRGCPVPDPRLNRDALGDGSARRGTVRSLRRVLGVLCATGGAFYTLRRWVRSGFDGFMVSGHPFVDMGEREYAWRFEEGARIPVEWEYLTCERCGKREGSWHVLYVVPWELNDAPSD